MEWYNGFSPQERAANGAALRKAILTGKVPSPTGSCALCGDPSAALEYHSEDYSKPYRWSPPAAYAVCRHCHRNKLHKRFEKPEMWEAFKAHVRRGEYACDLKDIEIKRELDAYVKARSLGAASQLRQLRPYPHKAGHEWWEQLASAPSAVRQS